MAVQLKLTEIIDNEDVTEESAPRRSSLSQKCENFCHSMRFAQSLTLYFQAFCGQTTISSRPWKCTEAMLALRLFVEAKTSTAGGFEEQCAGLSQSTLSRPLFR